MAHVSMPVGVCVKVNSLRPHYSDLEAWMKNKKHILVCRSGRVFIGSGETKHIFHYPSHEFSNPFTVKEHGLDKSLQLYREYLDAKLNNDAAAKERFLLLAQYEQIGCFCDPKSKCHRDVIIERLN
jgi:hypothetical protein